MVSNSAAGIFIFTGFLDGETHLGARARWREFKCALWKSPASGAKQTSDTDLKS